MAIVVTVGRLFQINCLGHKDFSYRECQANYGIYSVLFSPQLACCSKGKEPYLRCAEWILTARH